MEMRWREARQKTQLGAFVCLVPQALVCTGETRTWDRRIPFPSSTAWEGSLEPWDWHLGAGGIPETVEMAFEGRRSPWNWDWQYCSGPGLQGQLCPLELPVEKALFLEWEQGVPHKGLLIVGRSWEPALPLFLVLGTTLLEVARHYWLSQTNFLGNGHCLSGLSVRPVQCGYWERRDSRGSW